MILSDASPPPPCRQCLFKTLLSYPIDEELMPDIRFEPKNLYQPDCNWLVKHARRAKSQLGQDGVIEKIFDVIPTGNKVCVEFGAWDGVEHSNTWELIAEKGWSAILIEGNPDRCRDILRNHNENPKLEVVNTLVGWEGSTKLDYILGQYSAPIDFDFLSIDIDGNDFHVWNALDKYKPKVILVEFNPSVSNDVYFVQDPDPSINQGTSLRAFIELGKRKGYSLVCTMTFDAFFVRDEYYPLFKIKNNDIYSMHNPDPYLTMLFYGFDGTLFTAGRKKLLWSNVEFDPESFQILPKEKRVWNT